MSENINTHSPAKEHTSDVTHSGDVDYHRKPKEKELGASRELHPQASKLTFLLIPLTIWKSHKKKKKPKNLHADKKRSLP